MSQEHPSLTTAESAIAIIERLVDQIKKCNPVDTLGHQFQMNASFLDALVYLDDRVWKCTNCNTRFLHDGTDKPPCPTCKAFAQYTYKDSCSLSPSPAIEGEQKQGLGVPRLKSSRVGLSAASPRRDASGLSAPIPHAAPPDGWISVEMKLPEVGTLCMVAYYPWNDLSNGMKTQMATYIGDEGWRTLDGGRSYPAIMWFDLRIPPIPPLPDSAPVTPNTPEP